MLIYFKTPIKSLLSVIYFKNIKSFNLHINPEVSTIIYLHFINEERHEKVIQYTRGNTASKQKSLNAKQVSLQSDVNY